jgi:hypothetical protein
MNAGMLVFRGAAEKISFNTTPVMRRGFKGCIAGFDRYRTPARRDCSPH